MSYLDFLVENLGYKSYADYLKSEHWLIFSNGMRKKTCYCCTSNKELQIHHITYERLGEELPNDVVTVCGGCHLSIHELTKTGVSLIKAHVKIRAKKRSSKQLPKKESKWTSNWRQLKGSKTITLLQQLLEQKGLLSGTRATSKAIDLKFARFHNEQTQWNKYKFIEMIRAIKQFEKDHAKGKRSHYMTLERALLN